MQLGSKLRTRVAFNNSWTKTNGTLPTLSGSDPASTNYATGSTAPNYSLSGLADYTLKQNLLIGVRAGFFRQNSHTFGTSSDTQFTFGSSNIGQAGVPDSEQHPSGFANIPSNSATVFNIIDRKFLQGDMTWFTHFHGEHQVKGGFQLDFRGQDINSGNSAQTLTLNWGSQFSTTGPQGAYGYYILNSNAALPREGFITQGNVKSNVIGLFVQDTWSATNKLTLNLGLRSENEKVPAYTTANNDYGQYPIQFGFGDKIAPRLGAAYDLKGDGKWKIYGSWGMFYDIFKLDLGQQSFGGAKWIRVHLHTRHGELGDAQSEPQLPTRMLGHVDHAVRSAAAVAQRERLRGPLHRARHQADALAGSHGRFRASTRRQQRDHVPLRTQAAGSRHRRHRLDRSGDEQRAIHHRQPR